MRSYPAMGTVKAAIVPEEQRAAVYSAFRVPLNVIVLALMLCSLSYKVCFVANATLLTVLCMLQIRFVCRNGVVQGGQDYIQSGSPEETVFDPWS